VSQRTIILCETIFRFFCKKLIAILQVITSSNLTQTLTSYLVHNSYYDDKKEQTNDGRHYVDPGQILTDDLGSQRKFLNGNFNLQKMFAY